MSPFFKVCAVLVFASTAFFSTIQAAQSGGGNGQVTGAIFTTDVTGTIVNANIYDHKEDVYLNGGPQPNGPNVNCSAAGLPDGNYYFMVTNPSGSLLLSSDDISHRQVTISGGLFVSAIDHATGGGKCPGGIGVQLFPYADTDNPGGEYKVWITPISSYIVDFENSTLPNTFGFLNSDSKTDNFKVKKQEVTQVSLTGYKFYDVNTNGVWDNGEPAIPGWKIVKSPSGEIDFTDTTTPSIGEFSFLVLPNSGPYEINEVLAGPNWIQTSPLNPNFYTVSVGTENVTDLNFGNVCIGAGGGLTLGFWSNRNGQKLFGADDLTLMQNLHLRNANGTDFNPTSYDQFRTWILGATATNMANMLSAQLAAMELNVLNGKVDGTALVYAPGASGANAAGFISINALMAEADASLASSGQVLSGNPVRTYQEALKNALDNANNNRNFVQPQPCVFVSPY